MSDYINKLDDIADKYHHADVPDKFIEKICQEHTLEWIYSKLKGKTKILELGYGDGIVNKGLVSNNYKIDVIEGSPKVIAGALADNDQLQITQTLFEEFDCSNSYECILAMHVLEHVDEPVNLLLKMKQWLVPGGTIIVIVPNKNSLHRQLAVEMGLQEFLDDLSPRDLVVGHQRVYSHETLKNDVEDAGFKVIEETGFFLKSLPNGMMLDYSEDLIWAMNKISTNIPKESLANIGIVIQA